ncbi:MAG: hypothetical protein R2744_01930 [Bacteroidales bacterium]
MTNIYLFNIVAGVFIAIDKFKVARTIMKRCKWIIQVVILLMVRLMHLVAQKLRFVGSGEG